MEEENTKGLVAIFFDLDNTLIPTRSADSAVCNKVKQHFTNIISRFYLIFS